MNLRALVWAFPPSGGRHAGGCPEPAKDAARERRTTQRHGTRPPPPHEGARRAARSGTPSDIPDAARPDAGRDAFQKTHARNASARRSGRIGLCRAPPAKQIRGGISAPVPVSGLTRARKRPPPMRRRRVGIAETRTHQRTSFKMTPSRRRAYCGFREPRCAGPMP